MISVIILTSCVGSASKTFNTMSSENVTPYKKTKLTWVHSAIDSRMKTSKEQIAKKYMEMHSNIEIEIILRHPKDYKEWTTAKLAANSPIDIISVDNTDYKNILDTSRGYVADLTYYLEKINPYTGEVWGDDFKDTPIIKDKNGKVSFVPYQTKTSKFIYNKAHFISAGIDKVPSTWQEFIIALEKLKRSGYTSFGAGINDSNESLLYFNNFFLDPVYYNDISKVDIFTKDKRIQENEMIRGIDKGILNLENPDLEKALELYKNFKDYWNEDFIKINSSEVRSRFSEGKVSVILGSNWDIPQFISNSKLDWGILPTPIIEKELIPSSTQKVLDFEPVQEGLAITVQCDKKGKMQQAVDFLMSFTDFKAIYIENYLQIESKENLKFSSDTISQLYEKFAPVGESIPKITPILSTFGDSLMMDEICRETLLFLGGQIGPQEFIETLSVKTRAKVQQIMKERKWNEDNNYGEWYR